MFFSLKSGVVWSEDLRVTVLKHEASYNTCDNLNKFA